MAVLTPLQRACLLNAAKRSGKVTDTAKRARMLERQLSPTWFDKAMEVWYNWGLLSNPVSHAFNISGSAAKMVGTLIETGIAGAVGSAARTLGREGGVRVAEFGANAQGIVRGVREGIPAAAKAFQTERPSGRWTLSDDIIQKAVGNINKMKPDAAVAKALKEGLKEGSDAFDIRVAELVEGTIGGKQIRLMTRALMAEDEVFRTIGGRVELNRMAVRQAYDEGLKGMAHHRRVAELLENPTPDMLVSAAERAAVEVFQKPLGLAGNLLSVARQQYPALKIIIPFQKTITNLVKEAFKERSPLGILSKEVRDNIRGINGAVAQDEQIARLILGTMVTTALASFVASGEITGGGPIDPRHPERRAAWLLAGNKPYTMKINGINIDYRRALGHLGIVMASAADLHDLTDHIDDLTVERIAATIAASVVQNLQNQSWLQGPADLLEALNEPQRHGEKYLRRMVASFTTTAIGAQYQRIQDPYLHDARTMLDAIKARTPGMSQEVPYRRDIFGQLIPIDLPVSPERPDDPIAHELYSLDIWPSAVNRTLDNGVELTAAQYDRLQVVSGQQARMLLENIMGMPGWAQVPPTAKKEIVLDIFSKARQMGRAELILGDPKLFKDVMDAKAKAAGLSLTPETK